MPRLLLSNSPGLERRKEAVREVARAEAARSRFTALKGRMVLKTEKSAQWETHSVTSVPISIWRVSNAKDRLFWYFV